MIRKRIVHYLAITAVTLSILAGSLRFYNSKTLAQPDIPKKSTVQQTAVNNLSSDANGIQFELVVPPVQVDEDGNVTISGLTQQFTEAGAPALPYYTTYIALPPDAQLEVDVQEKNLLTRPSSQVKPASGIQFEMAEGVGFTETPTTIFNKNEAIYNTDANYPATLYSVSEPMIYRDLRLVSLQLYPLRYNPVSGELQQAQQLSVAVKFIGGQVDELRPLPIQNKTAYNGLSNLILNFNQAHQWRSLPADVQNAPATVLPVGQETFKLTVNETGIYDVTGADLAAAGMNIASVNPATIEMNYRGQPVAYQFIGDADTILESGEIIRFYGWAFADTGTRLEQHYVSDNVYWLWANGTADTIPTLTNASPSSGRTGSWHTTTKEPMLDWISTWTDQWSTFPNEADAWYWQRLGRGTRVYTSTAVIDVDLEEIDYTAAPTATYTVELFSRAKGIPPVGDYTVDITYNNYPTPTSKMWTGRLNTNISQTISSSYLLSSTNQITIDYTSGDFFYLNRITVEYMRHLIAQNDQLIMADEIGSGGLRVAGFNSNSALVWDITDPTQPSAVNMSSGISGSGPYTYTFGLNHAPHSRFIATTPANIKSVQSITAYTPPNLNPPGSAADWVAIAHNEFMTQTALLAAHRSQSTYGGLTTHIVDIEDIINQYGYGLAIPDAIRNYLTYALGNWTVAPHYIFLVGDATMNPRGLPCATCTHPWDTSAPSFVPTDFSFTDRFQGMIPSDPALAMISGNDNLPDMAIGRIAVNNDLEADNAIRKIMKYDQNGQDATLQNLPFLFVADGFDPNAGDFCQENSNTSANIPNTFQIDEQCLDNYATVDDLRNAMFPPINNGVFIFNYRGHGSINSWSGDDIMTTSDTIHWQNYDLPTVMLSADCLDGYFALPGLDSISETYMRYDVQGNAFGSAAMWSSSGLGYTTEHTVLHEGFYDGLFVGYGQTMGNAVLYSALQYLQGVHHHSEIYSFTLQGDPALNLYWAPEPPPPTPTPEPPTPTLPPLDNHVNLPVIVKP
ncbi:MAG: hypothetical protein GY796_04385 [Chloroflexi bacterium]|nr:hypothetical protein [Chloroflexota bacterium]